MKKSVTTFVFVSMVLLGFFIPAAIITYAKTHFLPNVSKVLQEDAPDQSLFMNYDRVFDVPDQNATPQVKYEHSMRNHTLYTGKYTDEIGRINSAISESTFESQIALSDNVYGYLGADTSYQNTEINNYYLLPLALSSGNVNFRIDFAHWLGPDIDSYLAIDEITSYDGSIGIQGQNIKEISRTVMAANDLYLVPNNAYYTFKLDPLQNQMAIASTTGAITLYNESIYQLFSAFQFYKMYDDRENKGTLQDHINQYYYDQPVGLQHLIIAIGNAMNLPENFEFYNQIKSITEYSTFVNYLGINLDQGYRIFTRFNPNFIDRIEGKVGLKIDLINGAVLESYTIEAFNYYANDWIPVYTRYNTDHCLENQWFFDTFYIESYPWQYIDDIAENPDQIQWRVIIKGNALEAGDLVLHYAGVWSRCRYGVSMFDLEMTFQIPDGITKDDLLSEPIFVFEYTTSGLVDSKETMILVTPLGNQTADPQSYYVSILPESNFYPSPYKDSRRGYPIPDHLIENDTTITLRLRGVFAKYTRDGALQIPVIKIDKIAMKYHYQRNLVIRTQALYDRNMPDQVDWFYEMDVTYDITYLEFDYPIQLRFLDPNLAMVQGPQEKDITMYWIKNSLLYTNTKIIVSPEILTFEGVGTYRFWFRGPNYISPFHDLSLYGANIINSTYGLENDFFRVPVGSAETTYRAYIKEIGGINAYEKGTCIGNYTVTMNGRDSNTDLKKKITFQGMNTNYTKQVTTFVNDLEVTIDMYCYNVFDLNYTHQATDNLVGDVEIEYLWISADGSKVGIAYRSIVIPIYDTSPAASYLLQPLYSIDQTMWSRWGTKINNTIVAMAWHPQTTEVLITISVGTTDYIVDYSLYRYADVLDAYQRYIYSNDPEYITVYSDIVASGGLPDLSMYPTALQELYWIGYATPEMLATIPINTRSGSIMATIKVVSIAEYTGFYSESSPRYAYVTLVDRPDFRIEAVESIQMGEYPTIRYNCPKGVEKIEFFVNDSINEAAAGSILAPSYFASEGIHDYDLPYPFPFAGNFTIMIRITDDIGNVAEYRTNRFVIVDTDMRPWLIRVLDELAAGFAAYITFFFVGIVSVDRYRKKKQQNLCNDGDLQCLERLK